MRSLLIGVGIAFAFLVKADPIPWTTGELRIVDGHLVARDGEGAEHHFTTITYSKTDEGVAHLYLPNAQEDKTRDDQDSGESLKIPPVKEDGFIRGVRGVAATTPAGRLFLSLLVDGSNASVPRRGWHFPFAGLFDSGPEPTAAWRWIRFNSPDAIDISAFDFGLASIEASDLRIFFYERQAGDLHTARVNPSVAPPNGHYLETVPLPQDWKSNEPFENGGYIEASPHEKNRPYYVYSKKNPRPVMTLAPGLTPLADGEEVDLSRLPLKERKNRTRMLWASGLQNLQAVTRSADAEGETAFGEIFRNWVQTPFSTDHVAEFHYVGIPQAFTAANHSTDRFLRTAVTILEETLTHTQKEFPHTILKPSLRGGATDRVGRMISGMARFPGGDGATYLIIDATAGNHSQKYENEFLAFIAHVRSVLNETSKSVPVRLRILIFGPESYANQSTSSEVNTEDKFSHRSTPLANILGRDELADLVVNRLARSSPSFSVSRDSVKSFLNHVTRATAGTHFPLESVDLLISRLRAILEYNPQALQSEENIVNSHRAYLRLTGERTFDHPTRETIQRTAQIRAHYSANSPLRGAVNFHSRDSILQSIQDQLLSFLLHDGPQGLRKHLILTWMGETGTGKTSLMTSLGPDIGAALESVNATDIRDSKTKSDYSYRPDEEIMLEIVDAKIARLRLRPEQTKILFIDEAHSIPGFLKSLLAATGDGDRIRSKALNLDGLIVVLGMNVDTSNNNNLLRLAQLPRTHEEYPGLLYQLFVDSIVSVLNAEKNRTYGSSTMDKKHVEALAGRLLTGLYYFPPLAHESKQAESLIHAEVEALERTTQARIVVHPHALAALKLRTQAYTAGNFRTAERALHLTLAETVSRYLAPDPQRKLKDRIFLLQANGQGGADPRLHLLDLKDSTEGMRFVLSETHRRLVQSLKLAVSRLIEHSRQTDPSQEHHEDLVELHYKRMLEAFTTASQVPLFQEDTQEITRGLAPNPGERVSSKILSDVGNRLTSAIRDLFRAVYQDSRLVVKETDAFDTPFSRELLEKASLVLRAMLELEKLTEHSDGKQEWLREAVSRFESDQDTGANRRRLETEIRFLKETLKGYEKLQENLAKTALENERQKQIAVWARETFGHLTDLRKKSTDLNYKRIETFIEHLEERSESHAREILVGLEAEQAQFAKSAATAVHAMAPEADFVRIAAGYYLDALIRNAAEEIFTQAKQPKWEVDPPRAATEPSTGCNELLSHLRNAGTSLDDIFRGSR